MLIQPFILVRKQKKSSISGRLKIIKNTFNKVSSVCMTNKLMLLGFLHPPLKEFIVPIANGNFYWKIFVEVNRTFEAYTQRNESLSWTISEIWRSFSTILFTRPPPHSPVQGFPAPQDGISVDERVSFWHDRFQRES